MGVDLDFLPVDCDYPDIQFSHQIVRVGRNYAMFDELENAASGKVRDDFTCYVARLGNDDDNDPENKYGWEHTGYGVRTETAYGVPMQTIEASKVVAIMEKYDKEGMRGVVRFETSFAFVKALPPDNLIALWFH